MSRSATPAGPGRSSMPDTAWPVAATRQAYPGSTRTPQFLCHLSRFRHVSNDSLALASRSPPAALSRRLLLIAHHDQVFSQRSMRWFGASLRRATPKGQDPSPLAQHRIKDPSYIGPSLRSGHSLWRPPRGDGICPVALGAAPADGRLATNSGCACFEGRHLAPSKRERPPRMPHTRPGAPLG